MAVKRVAASRALTARQVRELLDTSPAPDAELSGAAMAEAYRLDGGGALLVFEDGRGRRYESRAALLAMMGAVAAQVPVPPLAELLPDGPDFATHAPRLATELGIADLSEVDDLIRRVGPAGCLRAPMFGRLTGYIGELIRKDRGGEWRMEQAPGGAWEPWIVDSAGRRHAPFGLVVKELSEWGPESSLRGALAGHLQSTDLR